MRRIPGRQVETEPTSLCCRETVDTLEANQGEQLAVSSGSSASIPDAFQEFEPATFPVKGY